MVEAFFSFFFSNIFFVLLQATMVYFAFKNISGLKLKLTETLIFFLILSSADLIMAYAITTVGEDSRMIGFWSIAMYTVVLIPLIYKKTKNIVSSAFYAIAAVVFNLLASYLATATVAVVTGVLPSERVEQLEGLYLLLVLLAYIILSFTFNFYISKITGKFLQKRLLPLSDKAKGSIFKSLLGGAAIILAIYQTTNYLGEFLSPMTMLTINAVTFSLLFIYFVFSIFAFGNSQAKEMEVQLQNEILENLRVYTSAVESMATEMKKFRHDHTNLMFGFETHIQNGDISGIKSYYQDYMNAYNKMSRGGYS